MKKLLVLVLCSAIFSFCAGCSLEQISVSFDPIFMSPIFCEFQENGVLAISGFNWVFWSRPATQGWEDFSLGSGGSWCGVYVNGSAACSERPAGDGTLVPSDIPPGFTWKKLTITHHPVRVPVACGIKSDDTGVCWPYTNSTIMDQFTWKQLNPQLFYTCGLNSANDILCWTNDAAPYFSSDVSDKIAVPQGYSWKSFASNEYAGVCGIKMDDTLLCWPAMSTSAPSGFTWREVVAGDSCFCGIKTDGSAACWGNVNTIADVPSGNDWRQLSATDEIACGLKTDGSVECWGRPRTRLPLPLDLYCCATGEIGLNCQACVAGTYRTGPHTCENCQPGTFSTTSSDICEICLAGTYSDTASAPVCTLCPPGTYSVSNGSTVSTACVPCPAGTFNAVSGATACTVCPLTTSSGSISCGGGNNGGAVDEAAITPYAIALFSLSAAVAIASTMLFIKCWIARKRDRVKPYGSISRMPAASSNVNLEIDVASVNGYTIIAQLGTGPLAQTFKVLKDATGGLFALKMAVCSSGTISSSREVLVTNFEGIARHYESFAYELPGNDVTVMKPADGNGTSSKTGRFICTVMEFCEGGDMRTFIATRRLMPQPMLFREDEVLRLVVPLLESLVYIHERGVVHRNIKPQNILFSADRRQTKLAYFDDTVTHNASSTLHYMAPEVHNQNIYTTKSDVWSLGVVLLDTCTLTFAWESKTETGLAVHHSLYNMNQKQILQICKSISKSYSSEFKLLLTKMLQLKPEDRLSSSQLLLEPSIQNWKKIGGEQHRKLASRTFHPRTNNISLSQQVVANSPSAWSSIGPG